MYDGMPAEKAGTPHTITVSENYAQRKIEIQRAKN